ncbi:hypothetical protein BDP27DRAFT_1429783 [Rhodocollybia butyracea]|uniref:CxC1-like cysteine cluster associated with KDZ transposases domain-containing protein n=1 Tax=Rhodocollybia butyracea TaxID=206335 RepID=A0A9P5PDD2_9AGAR|nr:hypothetical protein BDP27DRAFT_1429783 [Rhodocollybia butyracea]
MSNTRRVNAAVRVRKNRNLRGLAHGLRGDADTQHKSPTRRGATQSLRLSQVNRERKKGAAADARRLILQTPDIFEQQDYHLPVDEHHDYNMQNYQDGPDLAEWDDDPDWVALGDNGEPEDDVTKAMKEMRHSYRDFRTRRDRTQTSNEHWAPQLDGMVHAYMDFCLREKSGGQEEEEAGAASIMIEVIDIFGTEFKHIPSSHDKWQSESLVRSGIIPTAPLVHNKGVTIRTVNLYHKLFVRCPRLGVQSFAKSLCDLEEMAFRPYLSTELYTAFDVYLSILREVRKRTKLSLGRSGREWRLLNACPSCQYRLKEDNKQDVRMLMAMDGNDSLKRVEHKEDVLQEREDAGEDLPEASKERIDRRTAGEEFFVSRAETSKWDEGNWGSLQLPQGDDVSPTDTFWGDSGCEEKWQNMDEKKTAKESSKFFENGWFVLLCCHMVMMLACDMVKSGELYQYPLVLLAIYLSAEKEERERNWEGPPEGKLGNAYDIHCSSRSIFGAALSRRWLNGQGVGIEDGEVCERYFSISNGLAAITRHQSAFHRRQAISEFVYYQDLQTYSNISKFIYGNYKQALSITRRTNALRHSMLKAGITSPKVFFEWLAEEGEYLQSLSRTPPKETLECEYYLKLEALQACQDHLHKAQKAWLSFAPGIRDQTNTLETKRRNKEENKRKLLADVHCLEEVLEVRERWLEGSEKWEEAKKAAKETTYRKALDKLEGLLVARVFEMSRLNVAGTGYKLRKHIANAMKICSKSISAAIIAYNDAATSLTPPRPTLKCEEALEFIYLSEFDILRNAREDVRERPWATPGNRLIMTEFFKLIRAEEEIGRLHLEIQRLITHMFDEEELILDKAEAVELEDPGLALQLRSYWNERGKFNELHRRHLFAIKKLPGFQPENLQYFRRGTHVSQEDASMSSERSDRTAGVEAEPDEPWAEDEDGGEDDDEILGLVDTVMNLTVDD